MTRVAWQAASVPAWRSLWIQGTENHGELCKMLITLTCWAPVGLLLAHCWPVGLISFQAGAMKQTSSAAEAAAVTEAEVQAGHGHAWGWTCMDLSFAIGGREV